MTDDVKALIARLDDAIRMEQKAWRGQLLVDVRNALEAATFAPAVDREALAESIRQVASRGQYQMPGDSVPYEQWSRGMADAVIAALGARDVRDVQAEAEKRGAEAMRERILRFADDDGLIDQNLVASITAGAIREARNER